MTARSLASTNDARSQTAPTIRLRKRRYLPLPTRLMVSVAGVVSDPASTTLTVNRLVLPLPLGIPEIVPDCASSVSPIGRLPAMIDHVYGGTPPVAESVAL